MGYCWASYSVHGELDMESDVCAVENEGCCTGERAFGDSGGAAAAYFTGNQKLNKISSDKYRCTGLRVEVTQGSG